MRHSVTTPGGFFIGIGGIAVSLVVAAGVYWIVSRPSSNEELRVQQAALGLAPTKEDVEKKDEEKIRAVNASRDELLKHAAEKYNGGKNPNIDDLEDLRGVVRLREAEKSVTTAEQALNAPSIEAGKSVITLAMNQVAGEITAKKPAASAVKADVINAAPAGAPSLPNQLGGGAHTMIFLSVEPAPAPAAAPAPSPAPAPAPAAPAAKPSADATPTTTPATATASAAPAPSRAPLLNGNEPTK